MPVFSVFCHLSRHLVSGHIVFHQVSPSQLWSALISLSIYWHLEYLSRGLIFISPLHMSKPSQPPLSEEFRHRVQNYLGLISVIFKFWPSLTYRFWPSLGIGHVSVHQLWSSLSLPFVVISHMWSSLSCGHFSAYQLWSFFSNHNPLPIFFVDPSLLYQMAEGRRHVIGQSSRNCWQNSRAFLSEQVYVPSASLWHYQDLLWPFPIWDRLIKFSISVFSGLVLLLSLLLSQFSFVSS